MTTPLALLIVEDVESDAQLIVRLLKKAGYELLYEQVETAEQMRAALKKGTWDAVISDYSLPQFDGRAALELLKEWGQDIPFIVVSGTIGEETAVAMMKAGAHDYVMKGDLTRLVPAMERELEQAQSRRKRKQIEEALRESEERYRKLVENSPTGILACDAQGKITSINPEMLKILGSPSAEATKVINLFDFKPLVKAGISASFKQVFNTGEPHQVEHSYTTKWDKKTQVMAYYGPIKDQGGKTIRVQVNIQDITARKQAEDALRESEDLSKQMVIFTEELIKTGADQVTYQNILENLLYISKAKYGALTLLNESTGKFTTVAVAGMNDMAQNAVKALGFELVGKEWNEYSTENEQLEGQVVSHFSSMSKLAERVFPEIILKPIEKLLNMGEVAVTKITVNNKMIGDFTLIMSAGKRFENDTFVKIYSRQIDMFITRGKAEDALRESENKLRLIFDTQAEGVALNEIIYDEHGEMIDYRIVDVNQAFYAIADYSGRDVVGNVASQLYGMSPESIKTFWETHRTRQTVAHTEMLSPINNKWFYISTSPFSDDKFVMSFLDITERKQAEEALLKNSANMSAIMENTQDSIWTINTSYEIVYVNSVFKDAFFTSFGVHLEPGISLLEALPESFRSDWKDRYDRTLANERFTIIDVVDVGTHSIYIEVLFNPISVNEVIVGASFFGRDITERKQAEEKIREKDIQFRKLSSNVPGLLFQFTKRPDGTYYVPIASEGIKNIFGCSPEDVLDDFAPIGRVIFPEDSARVISDIEYSAKHLTFFTCEFRVQIPGKAIQWIYSKSAPEKLADGSITWYGFNTDITERKQAEAETLRRIIELELLYQSGLTLSQSLNPKEIGQKILELLQETLNWHHTRIRLYHQQEDRLELLDFNQPGLNDKVERMEAVERFKNLITRLGQGLSGWAIQQGQPVRLGDVSVDPHYIESTPGIHSGLYVPMKLGEKVVGVISIESEETNAFSEADERLVVTLASQAQSAFENARLFEETRRRVSELEMLYESGLALNNLLSPKKIAHKIIALLEEKMNWHHIAIRLRDLHDETLEVLAFIQPNVKDDVEKKNIGEHLNTRIHKSGVGLSGWAIQNSQTVRIGDVGNDPRYVETYPGLRSGLYVPIKSGRRTLGVISIESEEPDAFSETDERLVVTLTNQAAQAIENTRQLHAAQHHASQLVSLHKIDQAITSSFDISFTLDVLLNHLLEQMQVDAAAVLSYQKNSQTLVFTQGKGFQTTLLQHTKLPLGQGLSGKAALERRSVFIPDLTQSETSFSKTPDFEKEGFRAYYGIPLIVKGALVGVLEIFHRSPLNPDNEWISFLHVLTGQVAIAIDNATVYDDLRNSNMELALAYDATIEGWAQVLELRDMETEGHSRRVVDLTIELAQKMGISDKKMTDIYRGALLHDIGKVGVPDAILQKPENLTDEERQIMQLHPVYAYEWLSKIDYLQPAIDIPYYHHERWDGTGYPDGLKGERIPLAARIFAIVDVWDALCSDRPYRKAWSQEKALAHIRAESGKHFDPKVVDAFVEFVAEGRVK